MVRSAAQPLRVRGGRQWGLGDQSGSVLIEAALILPAVLVIAFGVVMTGRVAQAQVGVTIVAREAGRTLATAPSRAVGLREARARALSTAESYGLHVPELNLDLEAGTFQRGGSVLARASYRVELGDLPLLGRVAVTVSASHGESIERYRSRVGTRP